MEHLRCVVERITYQNAENGYSVIKCRAKGFSDLVTVVGSMPDVHVGSVLYLGGQWRVDAKYGRQFSMETFEETLPATVFGIEKYLGSGLIKGIGPKFAKKIVQEFGKDTLDVIEEDPDALIRVPGIGKLRVERIKKSWAEQKEIKNIMLFLQSHDVSTSHATKIYKTYGNDSIKVVQAALPAVSDAEEMRVQVKVCQSDSLRKMPDASDGSFSTGSQRTQTTNKVSSTDYRRMISPDSGSSLAMVAEASSPYHTGQVTVGSAANEEEKKISHEEWLKIDLFERLSRSSFRSRFRLQKSDRQYIQEKGMPLIRSHAEDLIRKRLAPDVISNDGKQTPMRGHPVFIGQHATATCCRGCLEKWHGISKGRALTEQEQSYVVDTLMQWIGRQMQDSGS